MQLDLIDVATFTKAVDDCSNIFNREQHEFVDLDRVVKKVVDTVYAHLPKFSSSFERVPPVALMRFARGGKTTTIARVFDDIMWCS